MGVYRIGSQQRSLTHRFSEQILETLLTRHVTSEDCPHPQSVHLNSLKPFATTCITYGCVHIGFNVGLSAVDIATRYNNGIGYCLHDNTYFVYGRINVLNMCVGFQSDAIWQRWLRWDSYTPDTDDRGLEKHYFRTVDNICAYSRWFKSVKVFQQICFCYSSTTCAG